MGGSSKPATSTTNQTSTNTVTPYNDKAISGLVDQATQAYAATPKTPTYTGLNAQQLQAQNMLTNSAAATAAGAAPLSQLAQDNASGKYVNSNPFTFDKGMNPFIDQMIAASVDPLRKNLSSNILSIGDAAKLAGAYGGDRQDLLKATAETGFEQAALNTGANIRYQAYDADQNRALQAYQFERGNQNNAGALFDQANKLALTPAQIISALGDQSSAATTATNQAAIDAPWAGLDREATILGTTAPYSTTSGTVNGTTTSTAAKGSTAQGAIGGAVGGASAGAAFGPWGAGIGAVLGGLGGLFG